MSETDPAARAFEDLCAEMTVLRRSVEALPQAWRDNRPPDYTPDLARLVKALTDVGARMKAIEASPTLKMTPQAYGQGGTTGRAFRLSGHAGRLSYRDPCGSGGAAATDRYCRTGPYPGPSELVGAEGRAGLSGCRDRVLAYPDLSPAVITGDARGLLYRGRAGSVGVWCVDDGGRQSRKPAAYGLGQPACGRQSGPDRRLPENGQRDEGGPTLCPDHPAGWIIDKVHVALITIAERSTLQPFILRIIPHAL